MQCTHPEVVPKNRGTSKFKIMSEIYCKAQVHGFIQIIASKHAFEFGNFNLQTRASDRLHRFFPRKVRGRTAARMAFLLMEHARDVWQHEAPPQ